MSDVEARPWHPFKSAEAKERYLALYDAQFEQWPVSSEERVVTTDDGDTFVHISGPVDGPPLVLLPASRASAICWVSMIEALSERCRTYAVDAIYDVGRSVNRRPIKTVPDATGWVDRLLDGLGLDDCVNLVGLSLGGYTTAEYVLHAPARLAKVVWLAPAGVVAPISGGFIWRGMLCMASSRAFDPFMRWVMPDAARSAGVPRGNFEAAVEDVLLAASCFSPRPMPGGAPRALKDEELKGITTQVLYVVGANERVCADPVKALARVRELAPGIETELVDGCGHDIFWMRPDVASRRILQFIGA